MVSMKTTKVLASENACAILKMSSFMLYIYIILQQGLEIINLIYTCTIQLWPLLRLCYERIALSCKFWGKKKHLEVFFFEIAEPN